MNRSQLKLAAALVWFAGAIALSVKGVQHIVTALTSSEQTAWILAAAMAGIAAGLFKSKWLFVPSCRRNLNRIEALGAKRSWAFFRPAFFCFLVLMILAGAALSAVAENHLGLMVFAGALDLSIATALWVSSRVFWRR